MKKGFTLIELLAVILILGIIALIAIPTVTSIIKDSKIQSYIRSAEVLLSSVDTKINIDMLKGLDINVAYNFKDNKLLNGELDMNGTMPKDGKIRVNNDGEVTLAVVYDKYCITKAFTDDKLSANPLDENGCQSPGNNSTLKSYAYSDGENGWINREEVYYITTYRDNIVSISFLYQKNVPNNALISWDVSEAQDESIMAYLMPNGDKYDLYIISENNIYAPANSTSLFYDFKNLERISLNNFDTSNTTNMYRMFSRNTKLKELDLSGLNTKKVTSFLTMFGRCTSLEKINLSSFDTSKAKYMNWMFLICSSLTNLDIGNFDTSEVVDMEGMFDGCSSLKKLNISSFNTSKVTNMRNMFSYCASLTILDISSFNTSEVTEMGGMFRYAKNLTTIYKGNNWVEATNKVDMFKECGVSTLTLKN